MTKVPAIKTGTHLNFQRKKQHKFSSFSRQTFNCYASTHLFYKLMDNRKTKTAAFVENGLEVSEAHTCEESLEDYFKRVTGGEGIA
jgi:hypothetical protein